MAENPAEPLSFHPLLVDNLVLVNDDQRILAVRRDTGRPAWGKTAAIYQAELAGVAGSAAITPDALGAPRFTMTVFQGRLMARMGSPLTGQPQGTTPSAAPGYLVCLDLAAQGRLLWKTAPQEDWSFEGSPLADESGVYIAMRRQDIRPQTAVACFDADTGRLRWRRLICGAETPSRGLVPEYTHNLLTLGGGVLYYNTNLGAVAAVRADDGRILWITLYPRELRGDLARLAPHWRRDLNPCLLDRGTLYVAPADSPRIFAFDAMTGQPRWQTTTALEDAVHLLGASGDWLLASGGRLYWISLGEEDGGRVKHVWPDGPERHGHGRGVLAGDSVLWPTRDKLYIFDRQTARLQKTIDLTARGAAGGNLLTSAGQLLIATEREMIAIGPTAENAATRETTTNQRGVLRGLLMPEHDDLQAVQELNEAYRLITEQLSRVIVGQRQVIEELLVAMFARGHCLLVGVPGLAKTLLIRTLAESLALEFRRIQFTPDLMPSDITGTEVIQEDRRSGSREFRFLKGPIFGNVILADEINRTPPKTQAALLEAMQEYQITAGGGRHELVQPFFVLATQNPIEHEGTYPLPEAQLDRFMFNTYVDYPEEEEEFDIVRRTTADATATITPTLTGERILALQKIVRRVPAADHVVRYAMKLVRLSRPISPRPSAGEGQGVRALGSAKPSNGTPPFIRDYVSWGAGPRASQYLVLGAKARAVLHGRFYANTEDVRAVALPVLRHRIVTNFNAEAEGIRSDDIVQRLLDLVGEDAASEKTSPPVFKKEGRV